MRGHFVIFGIIVALAIAASVLLVPDSREVALMHFKDRDFAIAMADYQRRVDSGDMTVPVVIPLAQLYLQYGKPEKAVALLERFLERHPDNVEAEQLLADHYEMAQRPEDRLALLEDLHRRFPNPALLRELVAEYDNRSRFGAEIEALQGLIALKAATDADYINLGSLQAALGDFNGAVASLTLLVEQRPEGVDADTLQLLIGLLLGQGRAEEAYRRAAGWLASHRIPETAALFSGMLGDKGNPRLALKLLAPFADQANADHPDLLVELSSELMAVGQSNRAFAIMREPYDAGRLPPIALPRFIELALLQRNKDLAFQAAASQIKVLPVWILGSLAQAARDDNRLDFARAMVESLGDGFLNSRPILATELAVARKDQKAVTRWLAVAEAQPNASAEQRLGLASLYLKLGMDGKALAMLSEVAAEAHLPESSFEELANLYIKFKRTKDGLALLDWIRRERPSMPADLAWAALAVASGREEEVAKWLDRIADKPWPSAGMANLFYIASTHGAHKVAVIVAEQSLARSHGAEDRLRLAEALVDAGRLPDALPHLKALRDLSPEMRQRWLGALSAAYAKGAPVGDELRQEWRLRLAAAGTDDKAREEAVYALLELKDFESVLPVLAIWARERGKSWLAQYAESSIKAGHKLEFLAFLTQELARPDLDRPAREALLFLLIDKAGRADSLVWLKEFGQRYGGEWAGAYGDALVKLGRREEMLAWLREQAARPDMAARDKRELAFALLQAGDKRTAETLFKTAAEQEPPTGPNAMELLHLWGPRPDAQGRAWLAARARAATTPDAQAGWLHHLINGGGAREAAAIAASLPQRTEPVVAAAWLEALVAANDDAGLDAALRQLLPHESDPARLREYGQIAFDRNNAPLAEDAFVRVLAVAPKDWTALLRLGQTAVRRGDPVRAARLLGEYFAQGGGDSAEIRFDYAEALSRQSRSAAAPHYQRVVDSIGGEQRPGPGQRQIRAIALHRLGRDDEAVAALETLLAERPADGHLRADFASVLLDMKQFARAQSLLSSAPKIGDK